MRGLLFKISLAATIAGLTACGSGDSNESSTNQSTTNTGESQSTELVDNTEDQSTRRTFTYPYEYFADQESNGDLYRYDAEGESFSKILSDVVYRGTLRTVDGAGNAGAKYGYAIEENNLKILDRTSTRVSTYRLDFSEEDICETTGTIKGGDPAVVIMTSGDNKTCDYGFGDDQAKMITFVDDYSITDVTDRGLKNAYFVRSDSGQALMVQGKATSSNEIVFMDTNLNVVNRYSIGLTGVASAKLLSSGADANSSQLLVAIGENLYLASVADWLSQGFELPTPIYTGEYIDLDTGIDDQLNGLFKNNGKELYLFNNSTNEIVSILSEESLGENILFISDTAVVNSTVYVSLYAVSGRKLIGIPATGGDHTEILTGVDNILGLATNSAFLVEATNWGNEETAPSSTVYGFNGGMLPSQEHQNSAISLVWDVSLTNFDPLLIQGSEVIDFGGLVSSNIFLMNEQGEKTALIGATNESIRAFWPSTLVEGQGYLSDIQWSSTEYHGTFFVDTNTFTLDKLEVPENTRMKLLD